MRKSSWNEKNTKENNVKKAIFCGSFNPFHNGHLFVLEKGLHDFSHIYILVCQNENKPIHDLNKAAKQIEIFLKNNNIDLNRISIHVNDGFTVKYINNYLDTKLVIRGYRNIKDKIYERGLLKKYHTMDSTIKFVLYKSPKNLKKISSHSIKNDH